MSDLLALVVVGVAAAAAIVLVALPLLRSGADRTDTLSDEQRRRLALREERDGALLALRDLEFDHRTGKITDEDYRPLVVEYRRRVAEALQALDAASGTPSTPDAATTPDVPEAGDGDAAQAPPPERTPPVGL